MGNAATAKKIMMRGALSLCTRQFQIRVRAARDARRPSFAKPFAQENRRRVFNGTHSVLKFAPQSTRDEGRVLHVGGTRGSTLLVRVEDVVLRLHGHMARVSAV